MNRLALTAFVLILQQIAWQVDAVERVKSGSSGTLRSDIPETIDVRYRSYTSKELPDFQKHVIPLLGKLGCNGRSCHDSFQGRGGFQLSLFGYDFKADHLALLDESSGRVDLDDIDASLLLAKPLDADFHEGGQRFKAGSWKHHVLKSWISNGAIGTGSVPHALKHLEIQPSQIELSNPSKVVSLRVLAHWQDGSTEDVTLLSRFQSNDEAIATVSDFGEVSIGESGDTHVVISYDNAVVAVPVIRPYPSRSEKIQIDQSSHPIDRLVMQKLRKLNIQPSARCTDAEFVRRVSLDIAGILPAPDMVESFLKDKSPSKRERLIDSLLESDGYAAWWATRFSDWTGNSDEQLSNALPVRSGATRLWHEWLRNRIEANVPYDQIVEGIVTAESRNSNESYLEYCKAMTAACQPGQESQFAKREGLPLFWARRNFQTPEDRAIGFSYTFLGVRIECAQCHKHPFDKWSKDDFEDFAKLFSPIRANQNLVSNEAKKDREQLIQQITGEKKPKGADLRRALYDAAKRGETIPFGELLVTTSQMSDRQKRAMALAKKQGRKFTAPPVPTGKILGQVEPIELDHDPRKDLMDWLRSPDNPYFAKAIINRVWANYFGIGLVDPTDDMNLANPPSNEPLIEFLAEKFIEHSFDLKWLHRTIVTSDTYQRSVVPNATNVQDLTNFSHHIPRRLPAEVIYDAVVLATGSDVQAARLRDELDSMAIADGKPKRRNQQDFALEIFGQSIRESNCDCDRSNSPSLLQAVYLRNDEEMHSRLIDSKGWVAQACNEAGIQAPKNINDASFRTAYNRANSLRKQIIANVSRYKKATEIQQNKRKSQLESELRRSKIKLESLGFQMPSALALLETDDDWDSLERVPPKMADIEDLESLIDQAYLRALCRYPEADEKKISLEYIQDSENPGEGVMSLLWALVNTKEFIVSH